MTAWLHGLSRAQRHGSLVHLATGRRTRGKPLRRRRQLKTRRRWTWRSLVHAPIPQVVALAVVLGGLYALATSHVFAIRAVQAVGDANLPVGLFRRYCGCVGANIFLTQPAVIRWRLGRIPWVNVHQVYERLPDRVVIDASYRHPVLLWRTTMATYTVDMAGEVLYDVHAPPIPSGTVPTTATLPLVYSPHDAALVSGQHVPAVAVQMVLATRAGLAPDIAPRVNLYWWSSYSGLTVHSRLGWWFSLGINLDDPLQQRLDALDAAYKKHDLAGCNYVDLRPMPNIYCNDEPQWRGPLGPASH